MWFDSTAFRIKNSNFFGAARIDKESKEYYDTIKIGTILAEKDIKFVTEDMVD